MYRDLVTEQNWNVYVDETTSLSGFMEYVEATGAMAEKLENIMSKAKSFDELKNELLGLVNDRKAFLAYAEKHYP